MTAKEQPLSKNRVIALLVIKKRCRSVYIYMPQEAVHGSCVVAHEFEVDRHQNTTMQITCFHNQTSVSDLTPSHSLLPAQKSLPRSPAYSKANNEKKRQRLGCCPEAEVGFDHQ